MDALLETRDIETDAAGPEVFTFAEYVRSVAAACGLRRFLMPSPDGAALVLLKVLGSLLRDVILTNDELAGLRQELLVSKEPALGRDSVSAWLRKHGQELGRGYVNDLDRHFRAGALDPVSGAALSV